MLTDRRSWIGAAVAACLALSACQGQQEPETSPQTAPATESPATDSEGTGLPTQEPMATSAPSPELAAARHGGFAVVLPDDWRVVTADFPDVEIELALRADERDEGFYRNVVVTWEDPIPDLDAAVEDAATEVAGPDGEVVETGTRSIAGRDAPGYTVVRTVEGVEVSQTQWWLPGDDGVYVISLSAALADADSAQPVFDEVLDSWQTP